MKLTYDLRLLPVKRVERDAQKLWFLHLHYRQEHLLQTNAKILTMFCNKERLVFLKEYTNRLKY